MMTVEKHKKNGFLMELPEYWSIWCLARQVILYIRYEKESKSDRILVLSDL